MKFPITSALLLLCAAVAFGQDKPPAPAPSIDQTIDRIAELRAKRAELDKLEAAAVGDLKAQLKALNDKIDKLGLAGPAPVPVPPVPVDPLRTKLRDAFKAAAGTDAEKAGWSKDLAALYRALVEVANDREIATAAALKVKMSDSARTLMKGNDRLKEVRQAVAGELATVLPTTEADLTDSQRVAAAALFTRLAGLLEELAQ